MSEFVGPICFRVCTKCGESKPLEGFYKKVSGKFRRAPLCKVCSSTQTTNWRVKNPEQHRRHLITYRESAVEKRTEYNREWRAADPARWAAIVASWRSKNLEKSKAISARSASARRARKRAGYSPEADNGAVRNIYLTAQRQGQEVDHIFPLQGRTVSGLHVPANLRPICKLNNRKKHNKLPGFLAHELWSATGRDVYHEAAQ